MERNRFIHVKNIIFPCLLLSTIAGMFTGALIFLFKIAASAVISYSVKIYAFFRADPAWLPLFLVGAALLGLFAWLILCNAPHCRGGGIPTAVAILRGLIPFHWIKSIFFLFAFHKLFNFKWIKAVTRKLFKRTTKPRTRLLYLIDVLLWCWPRPMSSQAS